MKKEIRIVTALMLLSGACQVLADQAVYQAAIISEATPALWYKTARSPSYGTATNTLVSGGAITNLTADFWGNANSAFGLLNTSPNAAAVINSTGKFSTGTVGTVSFMFKTPSVISENDSLFYQGVFEVMISASKLRLTTVNGGTTDYTFLGSSTLSADTWYYFAMSWDLSKPSNDLTWYYGAANGTLNSGSVTMTTAGAANAAIYIGGHATYYIFGGYFQNIAVYETALSNAAIEAQFKAITKSSASLRLLIRSN
jgi:hypothetical protein